MTITITRGSLTDEELAALTAVLLRLRPAGPAGAPAEPTVERHCAWRRVNYAPPASWQTAA
ncbi:hypothetical protein KCMC57_up42820 [Kitasatospora sp. CMC57]|uniref:Acyl-CoA carboxylase subunit epsilon n=1 Tax=Kitasatospora sp. CMC57 TaxID=3231513 RepID=A0AB33K926_9ACTN